MTARAWIARVRTLSRRTQFALGAAIACVVVGTFAAAFFARDTRIALFASAVQLDQLAEVEERLAAWNVPYVSTGDNVRVDAARRNDVLLRLAVAGIPHQHLAATSEALGKAGALTPQSVLDAQEREGLAADLALALRGIAGVVDARVIIAPARNGTYADERDAPATASVRLTLAPGTRLETARVAAIATFVANGVPGLAPERVALLDDRGDALGAADATPGATEIQTALQSAIDDAFGGGAAIVRVRVERDERTLSVHETERRPYGTGTIAREASDERFATDKRRYAKTTTTEDRGSAIREERSDAAPGRILRVSVAVVVDSARMLDLAAIRALADATAGIDRKRGDVVSVTAVRFTRAVPPPQPSGVPWLAFAGIAPQVATIVLFLAVVAVAGRPAARIVMRSIERAEIRAASAAVAGAPPHHVRGALAGEPPHTAGRDHLRTSGGDGCRGLGALPRPTNAPRSSDASRASAHRSCATSIRTRSSRRAVHSFVPLDIWLRGEPPAPAIPFVEPAASAAADEPVAVADRDVEAAIAEARRFRAALADALDAAVAVLAGDIAAEVLGRELLLAPPALAAIVREAAARLPEIVRVRVHPRDIAALRACGAPAFPDEALRPGDALVEVVDGIHDATLGARMRGVLAAWSAA